MATPIKIIINSFKNGRYLCEKILSDVRYENIFSVIDTQDNNSK
jgi:hypothetical protein